MARPPHRPPPPRPRRAAAAPSGGAAPLGEADIDRLQSLLDAVPAPLEPLDVSMLDGFLCAVLVQPEPLAPERWLPRVADAELGRPSPPGAAPAELHALVLRRHRELGSAIAARQWFDPWVFEMTPESPSGDDDDEAIRAAVYPWVAGFATGFDLFPALAQAPADALLEPLALLYRHLDQDDLEDAEALQAGIDADEPPASLAAAVEGLVRATLLLADVAAGMGRSPAPRPRRPS